MGKLESYNGNADQRITDDDGHVVWDTGLKSLQMVPAAAVSLAGVSVVFPDFVKGWAYYYSYGGDLFPVSVCDVFATALPNEWGPGRAIDLPQTLLGTVPAETDHLDVQVRLTRTVNPSAWLGTTILVKPQVGEWFSAPEGTCVVESLKWLQRMFVVVRDGTDVYLRRYQSVERLPEPFPNPWNNGMFPWIVSNAEFAPNGAKNRGWLYGGGTNAHLGIALAKISSKGAVGGDNKNLSGDNACSLADPTNFSSTYSVDFLITPVRRS